MLNLQQVAKPAVGKGFPNRNSLNRTTKLFFPRQPKLSVQSVRAPLTPRTPDNQRSKIKDAGPLLFASSNLEQRILQRKREALNLEPQPVILVHCLSCKNFQRRQPDSLVKTAQPQPYLKTVMNAQSGLSQKTPKKQAQKHGVSNQNNNIQFKNSQSARRQVSKQTMYQFNQSNGFTPNRVVFTDKRSAFNNLPNEPTKPNNFSFLPKQLNFTKCQSNKEPNGQKWNLPNLTHNLSWKEVTNSPSPASASKQKFSFLRRNKAQAKLQLSQFLLGDCKGEGRYGTVYHAVHKRTGWTLAIKKIKKQKIRPILSQFINEIKIQFYLNHPNIIKLYGYFDDNEHIYLLLEYMEEGSLYKHIKQNQSLTEEQTTEKLGTICEAVSYMHKADILHRDLKPENIVISHDVCKICDFGWSVCTKKRRKTCCGTLDYTCPQVASGEPYSKEIDIWTIGVMAYEMLTGTTPFYHISRHQTMMSIRNCSFEMPNNLSETGQNFILSILQRDPAKKVRINDLLNDPFLQGIDKSYLL